MSFNKIITSGVIAVSLFGASIASAQVYYPPTNYTYGSAYQTPTYQAPYSATYGSAYPTPTYQAPYRVGGRYLRSKFSAQRLRGLTK